MGFLGIGAEWSLDVADEKVDQRSFADERWIEPVASRVLNLYTMI